MKLQYEEPVSTKKALLKRGLTAGLAVAGTAAVALGLYGHHAETFHHETARLLQQLASAKGIEVTLRDANGIQVHGSLLPKASSTAGQLAFDGRLSYELAGSQYNFTLLNDRAYVTVADIASGKLTRNECIHPDNMPPVATLTDALNNARVIDAVSGFNVTCASGKMVEFDFAGEPYVLCANPNAGAEGPGTVTVHGDDLQASLKVLSDNSEGVPTITSLAPPAGLDLTTCGLVTTASGDASLVTPTTASRLLQRTQDVLTVAKGERRLSKMATCGCTDGLKKCLFIHGLGYNASATTDSFKEYFGTIEQQAKCCSEVKFLHIDTVGTTWYDDKSTEAVCDAAVAMTGSTDKMAIENVALVAHSMGNLVVNAAFMNKKCALAKSSKYIALNGPMYGSASAASAVTIISALPKAIQERLCYNDPNTVIDDPLVNALLFFGLCPTRVSISSIVFKGSKPSTPELDALFTAAGEQFGKSVSSSLCGVSPIGLLTTDSIQLSILGTVSGHASLENDGQVHYDSCRATVDKSKYSTKWDGGNFYKAGINHLDGTFRNGDGWWGNDRKPIKWFNCQF